MLEDSGAKVLVTSKKYKSSFKSGAKQVIIEDIKPVLSSYSAEEPDNEIAPGDLAYILYTSGSTGKPKGVMIEHHSMLNLLAGMQKVLALNERDQMLAVTTISFDISIMELFLPLISGATVIIADAGSVRDASLLINLISKTKPSIMQATPSTWHMLTESAWPIDQKLKTICSGGESLSKELATKLLSRCEALYNLYGPTETTIWSSYKRISSYTDIITIGQPISNTEIYLLDEDLHHVAIGHTGEIFIAGSGLARGYKNADSLTAEKFLENPFTKTAGDRIYRTGDLGKLLENGEIQCLGRIDQQVKIRGHRIEPGEIESRC